MLFTRGISSEKKQTAPDEIDNKRERREILAFTKETAMQYDKNKEHFEKNMAVYQNSIRRLTESLRMHLETADETFMDASTHGRISLREYGRRCIWTIRVFLSEKMRWRRRAFCRHTDWMRLLPETDAAEDSSTGICTVKEPD